MIRILKLSFLKKFLVDMVVFFFLSIVITFSSAILPEEYFHRRNWIFKERKWEKYGKFYQDVFKVKRWKDRVPELADFVKLTFTKKIIKEFESEYLSKYLIESCKAELVHWMIILSTIIFWIFGNIPTFIYMLIIAAIFNVPFIIIQRYNRPRILLIMKHKGIESFW